MEVTGGVLAVIRLDDERRIVSMSPAAQRLAGVTWDEVQGMTLAELARREEGQAVLPSAWRRSGSQAARHAVFSELEDTARQHGSAMAWIWILTPRGRVYRCALNLVRLAQGFLLYLANVEDYFTSTLVQADQDGNIIDAEGTRWTFETLGLFEDFIRGHTLEQIASNHGLPRSRVRAVLDDLAASKNHNTAGAWRSSTYRTYADAIVPVRQAIFPVMSEELPDFPSGNSQQR